MAESGQNWGRSKVMPCYRRDLVTFVPRSLVHPAVNALSDVSRIRLEQSRMILYGSGVWKAEMCETCNASKVAIESELGEAPSMPLAQGGHDCAARLGYKGLKAPSVSTR
jgi:hypothetical protein